MISSNLARSLNVCSTRLVHLYRRTTSLPTLLRGVNSSSPGRSLRHPGLGQLSGRQSTHQSISAMASVTAGNREIVWQPKKNIEVLPASGEAGAWVGDLLVYGVPEDSFETTDGKSSIKSSTLAALDKSLDGVITEFVTLNEFAGKAGSSAFARVGGSARLVGVVGLGKASKLEAVPAWSLSPFQVMGAEVAKAAKSHKAKTAAVAFVDLPELSAADKAALSGRLAAGVLTGAYEATRFKEKGNVSLLEGVQLLGLDVSPSNEHLSAATAFASGTTVARYLVEEPPNVCTPAHLANIATKIAALAPERFELKVLLRPEVEALKMGLYLGVAEASENGNDLRFIHLIYKPKGVVKKRVGLVGKGLTYDSGGYNIKLDGYFLAHMKFDMGGSAAVLGAARAFADLQPEGVEVHFIIASCENMIAGKAMRPGDVLTAANGKTVEVNNTDAEGRLTLADALWYAQEHAKVESIIDIATLTGAMMVSLGQGIAGAMTPSDAMAEKIAAASRATGEKTWRLPLEDSYWDIMKSNIADMKNAGNRYAGSITAGLFLKQYVDTEKVEWAHVDIAGTAWDDALGGATGWGAAFLAQWAINEGK